MKQVRINHQYFKRVLKLIIISFFNFKLNTVTTQQDQLVDMSYLQVFEVLAFARQCFLT